MKIAEYFGHFEQGAGLDLVHEGPVAAIPGVAFKLHDFFAQNLQNFLSIRLAGHWAQPDLLGFVDVHEDLEITRAQAQDIELLYLAAYLLLLDIHDLGDAAGGVDSFLANRQRECQEHAPLSKAQRPLVWRNCSAKFSERCRDSTFKAD